MRIPNIKNMTWQGVATLLAGSAVSFTIVMEHRSLHQAIGQTVTITEMNQALDDTAALVVASHDDVEANVILTARCIMDLWHEPIPRETYTDPTDRLASLPVACQLIMMTLPVRQPIPGGREITPGGGPVPERDEAEPERP